MKSGVYYWAAADRIVYISHGRMIHVLSAGADGVRYFCREKSRSQTAKLKTLVYLGEL